MSQGKITGIAALAIGVWAAWWGFKKFQTG
jgi:hypothetical protein